MTITQRGTFTSSATASDALSQAVNKPTGVVAGDVLIALVTHHTSNSDITSGPSGWTKVDDFTTPGLLKTQVWVKVAGGSEPASYTWTAAGSATTQRITILCSAWAGADNVSPVGANIIVSGAQSNATEPLTTPSVTTTADVGRVFYLRASRVASNTPLTFSTAGAATEVGESGNNGAASGTSYSQALYVANADYSGTGSKSGLAITASGTETDNNYGTFTLKAAPVGDAVATLPAAGSSLSGHHRIDAAMATAMPALSATFEADMGPPEAVLAASLPILGVSVAATGDTGGNAALTLPAASSGVAGGVEALGPLDTALPALEVALVTETRPQGGNVIVVEAERRAFKVTNEGLTPIFRRQAAFPKPEGPLEHRLPALGVYITSETTHGEVVHTLPAIRSQFAGTHVGGDFEMTLPALDSDGEAASDAFGDADTVMPKLRVSNFGQVGTADGDFAVQLPSMSSEFSGDSVDGSFSMTLPSMAMESTGDFNYGASDVQLPALGGEFAGTVVDGPGGGVESTLPAMSSGFTGGAESVGTADATIPAASGSFAGSHATNTNAPAGAVTVTVS